MDLYGTKSPGRTWLSLASWFVAAGVGLVLIACLMLLDIVVVQLNAGSVQMRAALIGGSAAAAATALGTLPVLFSQQYAKRTYDSVLGFGAGVMLGATSFSLIIPALAAARHDGAGPIHASLLVGAGVLAGALLILLLDGSVSDDPVRLSGERNADNTIRHAWLFVAAVALHNLPEGLAIGVAYAGPEIDKAHSLATGISIQDVPEGLVVALALRGVGYGRLTSVGFGIASGLVEPVAAAFGVALIGIAGGMLPLGLAAAAGAMLFVIVHDVIPESHRSGNGMAASCALVIGFIVMTILDTALG